MPKMINLKIKVNDDELFEIEALKVLRAKVSELVRSEFDRLVKEECQKVIESRLKSNYTSNPLSQLAEELTRKYCTLDYKGEWFGRNDNPICQAISRAFNDAPWDTNVEKRFNEAVEAEVDKQVKEKLKAIREAMNT